METRLDWRRKVGNGEAGRILDHYRSEGYAESPEGNGVLMLRHPKGASVHAEQVSPRRVLLQHWSPLEEEAPTA